MGRWTTAAFVLALAFLPAMNARSGEKTVSVGYFPNITHAHALVAQSMAAEGNGWYESRMPGVTINWHSFNAGPSAIESLFAKAIDLTYVGPSPVLNAFIRSRGGVAVVSGAVRGGAGLVVRPDSGLSQPRDFVGKRIATPQFGNTQDIACRYWLKQAGLHVGDVSIVPTANSTMLALFTTGQVDAAWTVEPWLSRLEMDGGAILAYSEPAETSITTVLAVANAFAKTEPEIVERFVRAHAELTEWIRQHPEEAKRRVTEELTRQTRREFPAALTEHAWPRLVFDNAVAGTEFEFSLKAAQEAGVIKGDHDLSGLVRRQ